jgi:hypothetical protein
LIKEKEKEKDKTASVFIKWLIAFILNKKKLYKWINKKKIVYMKQKSIIKLKKIKINLIMINTTI